MSETPGKTKHFQTLELTEDVTLCDCPGLVMPSLANSKAGMVLQGILPIDQLRDHVPAINLLLSHVPPHVFEARYGLVLPRSEGSFVKVTSEKLLTAYGTLRGFMTARLLSRVMASIVKTLADTVDRDMNWFTQQ